MHAALSDRGANLAGLGISQCAPLGGRGRKLYRALFSSGHGRAAPMLVAKASSLNFGTGSFTVESWFNHQSVVYPNTFMPLNNAGNPWNTAPGWIIGQVYRAGGVSVDLCDGPNLRNGTIACDIGYRPSDLVGVPAHCAVVFDRVAGTARAIINGVLQSGSINISSVTGSVNNATPVILGNSVGWTLRGIIDGVRIYNRALPPYEVAEHYRGSFTNSDGLVGRWDFDEADGPTAYDKSGYGNHGTLVGNPQRVQVFKPDRLVAALPA